MTTPLVRILRHKHPDAVMDFAVSDNFFEILKYNPNLTNIFKYDKNLSLSDNSANLKIYMEKNGVEKYDAVVDLQSNIRSRFLRKGTARKIYKMKKNRLKKLSLVYFKRELGKGIGYIPDVYINTCKDLGIQGDERGLEFWLNSDNDAGKYLPFGKNDLNFKNKIINRVAIAPGAHHSTKRWPEKKFIELAERLTEKFHCSITLVGGTADKELCEIIEKEAKAEIINKSGTVSLEETASIIDECDLVISNDTAVMHIAAARQSPVAAIFGSTVPAFGFSPYKSPNVVIQRDISCRPCTHIGRAECPKKHFDCMNKIEVKDVLEGIDELLKKTD